MNITERFEGCIMGGAIGDALGSGYENLSLHRDEKIFYPFGKTKEKTPEWSITDDTQLTLATCEAIIENQEISTVKFAEKYLQYYKQRKISGIGSSTLKALRELEMGGHWSQVGRKGEYAAGNGAAMRIAPLGFLDEITKEQIREICFITHSNDEAYIGALSIVIALKSILKDTWTGKENLIEIIIAQIPDTRIRDRFIEINKLGKNAKLDEIGKLGNSGYVVDSVPLAIAAASKINELGMERMFLELVEIGGDTDTNCSIAGQISGALIGINNIPIDLLNRLKKLNDYEWIKNTVAKFENNRKWDAST